MLESSIAIALVLGIVEAFKRAFKIQSRYIPLISLAVGTAFALIFREDLSIAESVFTGIVIGLSSAGLYSGTKATIKG